MNYPINALLNYLKDLIELGGKRLYQRCVMPPRVWENARHFTASETCYNNSVFENCPYLVGGISRSIIRLDGRHLEFLGDVCFHYIIRKMRSRIVKNCLKVGIALWDRPCVDVLHSFVVAGEFFSWSIILGSDDAFLFGVQGLILP